ncbi:MAG: lipocalin family protein [Bacteroidota bacterium]
MQKLIRQSLLMILFLTALACSNDDNNDNDTPQDLLLGTWNIMSIQVSEGEPTRFKPSDETVQITFGENGIFKGSTTVNQFNGNYNITSDTLTMTVFTTTEVGDTTYGNAFYAAITAAQIPNETFAPFKFSLGDGQLTLTFGDSGQMILEQ